MNFGGRFAWSGVLNFEEWCVSSGVHYHQARRLLTLEINAAVKGFFAGGAREIVVADGHGPGGVNPELIDSRVDLIRGWPNGWPLELDASFDALAFVGQHAKAGTERSHLTHTQGFNHLDLSVNGVSLGEFGQLVACASELGVRTIFAATPPPLRPGETILGCADIEDLMTQWVIAGEGEIPDLI